MIEGTDREVHWRVTSAKKPQTRAGRIEKVVAAALTNKKPGMM